MIYFLTDIASLSPWDLIGKEVAKLISLVTDVRILERNRHSSGTSQGVHREVMAPEYLALFQNSGGAPGKAEGMIFHGSVLDAVGRIQRPDECSNRWNVALVTWPSDSLSDYWVQGLNLYDEVWVVTYEELIALEGSGVENVRYIRIPYDDLYVHEEGIKQTGFLYYNVAVGTWNFPDNLCAIYDNLSKKGGKNLFICPDGPVVHNENFIFDTKLNRPVSEWIEILGQGTSFCDASVQLGGNLWRPWSIFCKSYKTFTGDALVEVEDGRVEGIVAPQKWKSPSNLFNENDKWQKAQPTSEQIKPMQTLIENLNTQTRNRIAKKVFDKPRLAIVVPYGDVDPIQLEQTVLRLETYLDEGDLVIVSEISKHVFKEYEYHAHYESDTWNMSRARNQGAKLAKDLGCTYVWFHDVDIVASARVINEIKETLNDDPTQVLLPSLSNEDRYASGLLAMSIETLFTLGGFDEGYEEYGREDLDFLYRYQNRLGMRPIALVNKVYHEPHPHRYRDESIIQQGKERFQARVSGNPKLLIAEGLK